jgi:hypothetical protein
LHTVVPLELVQVTPQEPQFKVVFNPVSHPLPELLSQSA